MAALEIDVEKQMRAEKIEALPTFFQDYVRRLRSSVRFSDSIKQAAEWIVQNTKDPRDEDKPFSFAEHEYQIEICNDDSPDQVIQKCSQVGASELAVRRLASMMGMLSGVTAIYTMPSANPAKKFCKERIDPIVASCYSLSSTLNKDVDNTEMKQFGNNFLHISGTFGAVSAISVPTKILIKDEINFSNSAVLGKFKSRMSHNKPGESLDISFSTPTEPGIGVSEKFAMSDKKYYHVLHDQCQEWVVLNYEQDCVVIPGFNDYETVAGETKKTILDWEAEDAENPDIDISGAWYRCPCCLKEVTAENLSDPSKRKWIATADSPISGRQIFPHDVPTYNPLDKILSSLGGVSGYTLKADWVNFCLGLPYNDKSTKFDVSLLTKTFGPEIIPEAGSQTPTVAGLDVGKTSWFKVGIPMGKKLRIIYAEKIVNSEDGTYLQSRTLELCKLFSVKCLVVDTAPDISAFRGIRAENPEGHTYGAEYVRNRGKMTKNWEASDTEQIVKAFRTGTFNSLCQDFNAQVIEYCSLTELPTIKEHIDAMSRVTLFTDEDEKVYRWVNGRKPDHYAHALLYARLAMWISESGSIYVPKVVCLGMSKVKLKSGSTPRRLIT